MWGKASWQFHDRLQPILLLDACPVHMGLRFLRACAKWRLWVVFVPARMTWLLQPADTHCFAMFKAKLRELFQQSIINSKDGTVTTMDIILHMNMAIRRIFQGRCWSEAFDGNGWAAQQEHTREKIWRSLQCSTPPQISSALPSLEQFQAIFPKRRMLPLGAFVDVPSSPTKSQTDATQAQPTTRC